jgi:hypothetical protein
MRACLLIASVAACGGKPGPKPVEEPKISAKPTTRVPIEDDSEPEPGVTVINARGHMEREAIEAGLAPHTGSLSDCYTTKLNKRRWLGGHVALHWDISKDGTITAVKLAESDLGAWEIEKCLVDIARAAEFGKPVGGDADFMLPLDFSAKGQPQIWDEEQGLRAVGGQLVKLEACEKPPKPVKPLPHKPKVAEEDGKTPLPKLKFVVPDDVTITIYVGPGGKAQSVGFASPTSVIVDDWAACAEKAALAWRLPDTGGHVAKLAVRYRAR